MKPSVLTTNRLILRPSIEGDNTTLFLNYTSDVECARFLTRRAHNNIEQTERFLRDWCIYPWKNDNDKFAWVVALKNSNEAIGVFLVSLQEHKAEIHFGISRQYWRQGLTSEYAQCAVEWLKAHHNLQRIWTACDLENYGSIKILEFLKFNKEGILHNWLTLPSFDNAPRDCLAFGIYRDSALNWQ